MGFVVALLMAILVTLMLDSLVERFADVGQVPGMIERAGNTYTVRLDPREYDLTPEIVLVGDFTLNAVEFRRGWPLVTSVVYGAARFDLNRYMEAGTESGVVYDESDPVHVAVIETLAADVRSQGLVEAYRTPVLETERKWRATFLAIGTWWIILFILVVVFVRGAQFVAGRAERHSSHKRWKRQASNKCQECGYDMRGLEFTERCPECGALS